MAIDIHSWHVGGGTGIAGLIVLGLIWRSIRFVMRLVLFLFVLALATGAWVGFEYYQTGHLPLILRSN